MSRVLLTGATGFVGAPTLKSLLQRGHQVQAVARRPGAPQAGVSWIEADLLQPGSVTEVVRRAQATHLVHLAWEAAPGKFWTAPENADWAQATARLVEDFAAAGGRRAVLAGSCAEYRWDEQPLDEYSSELVPATPYGRAKLLACTEASRIASERRLELAWARLFFLYGPGEQPGRLVSDVAARLVSGERVPTTAGTQTRDFLHVFDAAEALAAILDSPLTGPINVCAGQASTVRELVSRLADAAEAADRVDFGALPMRPGDPAQIVGRASRLHGEVGFTPRIGLAEGLAETLRWWRECLAASGER